MTTYRNNLQRAQACVAILSFGRLERFWILDALDPENAPFPLTADVGPTLEAIEEIDKIKKHESRLSMTQSILLQVAFDFWNGDGGASLHEIQVHLDVNIVHAIGLLLIAANENPHLKGAPVDGWISRWRHYAASQRGLVG